MTIEWLTGLDPFFSDRCWQFVLLARKAPVGVVMRRCPSHWWQWFRGSLYPQKCDLAANGELFSYFGAKGGGRGSYRMWIAVSRPPYFTALALWPVTTTWEGHTTFLDDGSFQPGTWERHTETAAGHYPDHPPGPLRLAPHDYLKGDPSLWSPPWERTGWKELPLPDRPAKTSHFGWRKTVGKLCLERAKRWGEGLFPSRERSRYTLYTPDETTELARFEAHWADFDQRGRLVATIGGRILEGKFDRRHGLHWRQLAAFQDEKPERMEAPEWAQHW